MADCGASGSAVDQVARAVIGASSDGQQGLANATKHVGALLGHATVGASLRHAPMPTTAPDHLVLPGTAPAVATAPSVSAVAPPPHLISSPVNMNNANGMDAIWQQSTPAESAMIHHSRHAPPAAHYMPPTPQMQLNAAMHQQQQAMMHQYAVMQQQQQIQQAMQAQAMHQMSNAQTKASIQAAEIVADQTATSNNEYNAVGLEQEGNKESLDNWHADLEKDFESILKGEIPLPDEGHEGIVQGANIEDLAAAWAQAQEDFESEPSANLWGGAELAADSAEATGPPEYDFVNKELPADDVPNRDFMGEGLKYFREGNLRQAIRSFEMELQHRDADNATAWRMLGRCHAENDQDREAIACLEQAVDRDPYSPEALLALGVSYVNELDHERALVNLKSWITHNPKYAGLELEEDVYGVAAASETQSQFDEVQRLLLRALEFDSSDAADVWEALGVVYNVSRDYEAAVNAFRTAIENRPDDYQLWNKLGATLANSNQSEKALPAYHKALELKPKYARAWLNMAISHSNLQDYHEAARCYLQTLSLNPSAVHCWSYLRVALSCSERWDLIPHTTTQDLSSFMEHFDFVMYDNASTD